MPGYNCSIKERMLYSSCKASLVDRLESQLGLEITKKVPIIFLYLRVVLQPFSVIVTLLGPEKIVTISECHNNR